MILLSRQPFFSVVIPLYNRRDRITTAVRSVLSQSFPDFEVIVIDDGSTDNPEEVLHTFHDVRLVVIRQDNQGGSAARNAGIDRAQGQYIAFLDSDDTFLPDKLACVHEVCQANLAEVFFSYTVVDRGGGTKTIKPTRPPRPEEPLDEYIFSAGQTIQTSTLVVKADTAKRIRFKDGLAKGQDLDFVVRLHHAKATFHMIEAPLSVWYDVTAVGRVSHTRNAEALRHWLQESRPLLTPAAYYGFRANILSYEIAQDHPLEAVWDIILGILKGHVTFKRALHSAARAFIPRQAFRRLANWHMARRRNGEAEPC